MQSLADEIDGWTKQKLPNAVYWATVTESRRQQQRVNLYAAPIDVGEVLREQLFGQTRCVVLYQPRHCRSAVNLRSTSSSRGSV
ncbi:MAG: hypothetical protein R3C99_16100 [Pirellulaceae bacterium]